MLVDFISLKLFHISTLLPLLAHIPNLSLMRVCTPGLNFPPEVHKNFLSIQLPVLPRDDN